MLKTEHVRVRRRGHELKLVPLSDEERPFALEIASTVLEVVEGGVGQPWSETEQLLRDLEVPDSLAKLKDGLVHLVEQDCELGTLDGEQAAPTRQRLFREASLERAKGPTAASREEILARVAAALGLRAEQVEARMFADLKSAQVLVAAPKMSARSLVDSFDLAQEQTVLLRATQVVLTFRSVSPNSARYLFRWMKFLKLLYQLERTPEGFRLTIDGPGSLFGSTTRYGLKLALLLPALAPISGWNLRADLIWGRERLPVSISLASPKVSTDLATEGPIHELSEDAQWLFEKLGREHPSGWSASPADALLDLPGQGLVVPDLLLKSGRSRVYVEFLGYWSRAALWKRVEWAQGGNRERILFCASDKLRVSEEVMPEDASASLYVFRGRPKLAAILERLEALSRRKPGDLPSASKPRTSLRRPENAP